MAPKHFRISAFPGVLLLLTAVFWAILPTDTQAKPAPQLWQQKTTLALPFNRVAYVSQGWSGKPTHSGPMQYAIDFVFLNSSLAYRINSGSRVEDYYTWGALVSSPADGVVVDVENGIVDNPINKPNPNKEEGWGNFIIIRHDNFTGSEYSLMANFKKGSITKKVGDRVKAGDIVGEVGNSGFSLEPHVHYQLQDSGARVANSLPVKFSAYFRLDGNRLRTVSNTTPEFRDIITPGPNLITIRGIRR